MTKKISKLLFTLLIIIMTISSFSLCYADEAVVTSETKDLLTATEETTTKEEIYSGDLYIFDNDIVMDKLVDGNVFIFGTNVEITGQVNGNLFVFANNVSFNQSYIRYSIFACANSVYYNGACNDLYVATNDLEMTYDSYVVRDVKAVASNTIFKAAIGRDVDLISSSINLGEGENIPVVYGNLRYTSDHELEIPEGVISKDGHSKATYTKASDSVFSISSILIGFATCVVTVLSLYIILNKLTPNVLEKLSNKKLTITEILRAFGIGLLSLIIVLLFFVLLLGTTVGAKLSIILVLLYAILCLISVPSLTIIITNMLKPAFKIEKTSMFCLILSLVSVVLYGITLIPFVGGLLGLIIKFTAIGLLIDLFLPHKELTEEEKIAIEEEKKQAKEIKEKKKQEKLAAKEAKKQAKLDEIENPIKENKD